MSATTSLPGDKRARTRDQLLAAAQEMLMEHSVARLGVREIAARAGLVHGTFYNYFEDLDALIEEIAALLAAAHADAAAPLVVGVDDPAVRFARITRQALRTMAQRPLLGRLLFEAGLPAGALVMRLRAQLRGDIAAGVHQGVFRVDDVDLAASLTAGAISGLAQDIHAGLLAAAKIDAAVAALLVSLGVTRVRAMRLATEPVDFPEPPATPLRWLALSAPLRPGST